MPFDEYTRRPPRQGPPPRAGRRGRGRTLCSRALSARRVAADPRRRGRHGRGAAAFEHRFGAELAQEVAASRSAGEDSVLFAAAWGVPAVVWANRGIDPDMRKEVEEAGKLDGLRVNHPPDFAPVLEPAPRVDVEAVPTAAGLWSAGEGAET